MPTRAIHLVTTTYMTWLPGDDRRHWSPLFDLYGRLIDKGHRLSIPDFDDEALMAVQEYIEDHNLRRNLPRAPYPWIHPPRIHRPRRLR